MTTVEEVPTSTKDGEFSPDVKALQDQLANFNDNVQDHAKKEGQTPTPPSANPTTVGSPDSVIGTQPQRYETGNIPEQTSLENRIPELDTATGMIKRGGGSDPCNGCPDVDCTVRGSGMSSVHCRKTVEVLPGGMIRSRK